MSFPEPFSLVRSSITSLSNSRFKKIHKIHKKGMRRYWSFFVMGYYPTHYRMSTKIMACQQKFRLCGYDKCGIFQQNACQIELGSASSATPCQILSIRVLISSIRAVNSASAPAPLNVYPVQCFFVLFNWGICLSIQPG